MRKFSMRYVGREDEYPTTFLMMANDGFQLAEYMTKNNATRKNNVYEIEIDNLCIGASWKEN